MKIKVISIVILSLLIVSLKAEENRLKRVRKVIVRALEGHAYDYLSTTSNSEKVKNLALAYNALVQAELAKAKLKKEKGK